MDMYKLATEQAAAVKEMVEILRSIDSKLTVIGENQIELYEAIEELGCRVAMLEDDSLCDEDGEDFLFDDEDDCDCGFDCEDEDDALTLQELVEMAVEDINELTSVPQLPYRQFGTTFYEYMPNKQNPIQFIVNEEKRTVVALMKDEKGKVVRNGKARCAPDDQFVPWIGMVIACYRLFDYDVPTIFTE